MKSWHWRATRAQPWGLTCESNCEIEFQFEFLVPSERLQRCAWSVVPLKKKKVIEVFECSLAGRDPVGLPSVLALIGH